jgi:tRNA-splicing ligase RtcB
MKGRELQNMGIPKGEKVRLGLRLVGEAAAAGLSKDEIRDQLRDIVAAPDAHLSHAHFAELAAALAVPDPLDYIEREIPAEWKMWGADLEADAIRQMENACRLPVSVAGALMPDAHTGYGLPIGGVLATEEAVIPYAVGVDIACRMKLSVLDVSTGALAGQKDRLINVLQEETRFGIGAHFDKPHDHDVMDRDWSISPVTEKVKDRAWTQLGSSGSGNHFVEFGLLTLTDDDLGLEAGQYVALLSHSGSRGAGATVANHFSKLAMSFRPELPKELQHLAWLDMDSEAGQEYWAAMNLMGEYAAANHAVIHREVAKALGAEVLAQVENHHNFAWQERHFGKNVYVHRKGATPANAGELGVIPGSMASPAYVVRGKGKAEALRSASHGAGRVMSRRKAKSSFTWSDTKKMLASRGVTLISAGLDEVPGVYKDIDEVMGHQRDLVDSVARFDPKIVKMAPPGERPED